MRGFVGLGSNLGSRRENLEMAVELMNQVPGLKLTNLSSLFENSALLDAKKDLHTQSPFLNAVAEVSWQDDASKLLNVLLDIETQMGRTRLAHWEARCIDIDLLLLDDQKADTPKLSLPHPALARRNFVLAPLKELAADLVVPGGNKTVADLYEALPVPLPQLMHILNLTPDSFSKSNSDHSQVPALGDASFSALFELLQEFSVSYLDVGAESTRPKALAVSADEEWKRLHQFLLQFSSHFSGLQFAPKLSLDTWKASIAVKGIEMGVHTINDVSGLKDPDMLSVLKDSQVDYVLTHSLSVPADPNNNLNPQLDPVKELCHWLDQKIELLLKHNISLSRILFDPGIGFGKTAAQSLYIMKNLNQFKKYPLRLLIGHSRKSFMNHFTSRDFNQRDFESLGLSMGLMQQKVDVLRIHNSFSTARAFLAWQHLQ